MELANWAAKFRVRMPPTETEWDLLRHQLAVKNPGLDVFEWQKDTQRFGLIKLLARQWFNTVWVLQEVDVARTAKVLSSNWVIPAQIFAMMPKLLDIDINSHARAVLDIMPRYRTSSWWSSDRSLAVLMNKYAASSAALPRDKIYALLRLSDDACDLRLFYPCHKKSDAEVFRDTASFIAFGEILHRSYLLPKFTLATLESYAQVLYSMLMWLLARDGALIRRIIALLVSRLNEGKFGEEDTATG